MEAVIKATATELRSHAPYTLTGTLAGVIIMLLLLFVKNILQFPIEIFNRSAGPAQDFIRIDPEVELMVSWFHT
jgi:hypothetical protein